MKVLFLSASRPNDFSYGGAQRDNNLRNALAQIASVDTIIWSVQDRPNQSIGWDAERTQSVAFRHSAGRWERFRTLLRARKLIKKADQENAYDLIVVRNFPKTLSIPLRLHSKLVVDADDLRANDLEGSAKRRLLYYLRLKTFRHVGRRAKHVWLVDTRDKSLIGLPEGRTSHLPNVAKLPNSANTAEARAGNRILMVGFYNYPPNEEGLNWFISKVMPKVLEKHPSAELHAVGKFFQPALKALKPPIIMKGFVEDLEQEYRNSDVVICPIWSGSGTQIKVIEALMHTKPTVVTTFCYNGFASEFSPDEHLLVAQDAREFADKLITVLNDPKAFAAMAKAGYHKVKSHYSVDSFTRIVHSTIQSVNAA
jgi:glycosyltransferase involved in cell wall biosynthesis